MTTTSVRFHAAIDCLATRLNAEQPHSFSPAWIARHCASAYRIFSQTARTELDQLDWDRVTCALPRKHQPCWRHGFARSRRRKPPRPYRNQNELDLVLAPYRGRLYTFVAVVTEEERSVREWIAIRLVRLAQKGNLRAMELTLALLNDLVDQWMEQSARLSPWKYHKELLQPAIARCVHRYRYTGSFLRYLFRSLECGSRGLRAVKVLSLDAVSPFTGQKTLDRVVHDSPGREIRIF